MASLVEKVNAGPMALLPMRDETIQDAVAPVVLTTPAIAVTAAATMGMGLGAGLGVAKNAGYLGG